MLCKFVLGHDFKTSQIFFFVLLGGLLGFFAFLSQYIILPFLKICFFLWLMTCSPSH